MHQTHAVYRLIVPAYTDTDTDTDIDTDIDTDTRIRYIGVGTGRHRHRHRNRHRHRHAYTVYRCWGQRQATLENPSARPLRTTEPAVDRKNAKKINFKKKHLKKKDRRKQVAAQLLRGLDRILV